MEVKVANQRGDDRWESANDRKRDRHREHAVGDKLGGLSNPPHDARNKRRDYGFLTKLGISIRGFSDDVQVMERERDERSSKDTAKLRKHVIEGVIGMRTALKSQIFRRVKVHAIEDSRQKR